MKLNIIFNLIINIFNTNNKLFIINKNNNNLQNLKSI